MNRKMNRLGFAGLLACLVSCTDARLTPYSRIDAPYAVGSPVPSIDYFPEDAVEMADVLSGHLAELEEPSLLQTPIASGVAMYRFSCFTSVRGDVVIRVVAGNSGGFLILKRTDGGQSRGWRAGSQIESARRELSATQVRKLVSILSSTGFAKLPSRAEAGLDICDGDTWILESSTPSGYHVVTRLSPHVDGIPDGPAVVSIGEMFMALSSLSSLAAHKDQVTDRLKRGKVQRCCPDRTRLHSEDEADAH